MISKKVVTSSLIYISSSALTAVSSFILLPFYTNTGLLTVSDYGALILFIGVSVFVQAVATFSIDFYVAVVYQEFKDEPLKLKGKIASLNGFMLLSGLVILVFFIVTGNFFIRHYMQGAQPSSFRYLIMSVLTGIFNAHFKFYTGLLINQQNSKRFLYSSILNFVTTIVFTLVILRMFPLTLEGPLWGRLLSGASIFALSFIDVTRIYGIALRRETLKPLFQFCFPLFLMAIFQWVLNYSYVYIIKPLLFNEQVAIFDLAVKFTLLINFVVEGIGSTITPRIFSLLREEQTVATRKEINKYYSSLNLIALIVIPLNIFLLPIVVPFFLSNAKYLAAFLYFGLVAAGIFTISIQTVLVNPTHFYKQTKRLAWVYGIAAVIQLVLSYVMIKRFNLYGAAFALISVRVVQIILLFVFCGKLITSGINIRKMVILPLIALAVIIIGELSIKNYGLRMHFIHVSEMLIIGLLSWFFYKNELSNLWEWGRRKLPFLSYFS